MLNKCPKAFGASRHDPNRTYFLLIAEYVGVEKCLGELFLEKHY
jgi:hypothetical protein